MLYAKESNMKLSEVVPWGRSLYEYRKMFSLSDRDIKKTILGCGDGPASFNAELSKMGGKVVSVDPVYQCNVEQIRLKIYEVYPKIMEQMSKIKNKYVWTTIENLEDLGKIRMEAMEIFLSDFEVGKDLGRYITASLPSLPFENNAFELALCSHYLFLYGEHVNQEQHISSIKELCRVADEIRIYPLLSLDGKKSKYLNPVMSKLTDSGVKVSLKPVGYEFQKGATEMMVVETAQKQAIRNMLK